MKNKLIIAGLIGGGVALAAITPAFAHTPEVTHTCDSITASLSNYETGNVIQLFVDGEAEETLAFDNTFSKTWDIDGMSGHTYEVVVDAAGTEYDRSFTGATEACPVTETPTPTPSIGEPEYPPTETPVPEDVYVPEGPGPEETAVPAPLPEDSDSEGLAVTGPELGTAWLGLGALAVGGTLFAVARLRRKSA